MRSAAYHLLDDDQHQETKLPENGATAGARELSANRLALDIGVPSGRITDILAGRRAITADTAVRLGRYFGKVGR